MNPSYRRIGEFLKIRIPTMEFIGITDGGEVLVSFKEEDAENFKSIEYLRRTFPNEISKVTVVETVSLSQAKHLLDQLEESMAKQEQESKWQSLSLIDPRELLSKDPSNGNA